MSKTLTIIYTGQLYKKYNISKLFEGIYELINENKIPPDAYQIIFYGTRPKKIEYDIKRYNMQNIVKVKDRLSHKEILEVQRNADILLLFDWEGIDDPSGGSTKMYEYLTRGRPILIVGSKKMSDMKRVVCMETHTGVYCDSVEDVKKTLYRWWIEECGYEYTMS